MMGCIRLRAAAVDATVRADSAAAAAAAAAAANDVSRRLPTQ